MSTMISTLLLATILGQQSTAPTKGTFQLPGDNGKLATTYQLGQKDAELHFTLDSVNVASTFAAPEDVYVAGEDKRLLILNFTVQNPQNKEMSLGSQTFSFTVVSPDDENYEFRGYLLSTVKKNHLSQSLKPAQKIKCTAVFPIYATGPITKLMVAKGQAPVLRYDLTDSVTSLPSIFFEQLPFRPNPGNNPSINNDYNSRQIDLGKKISYESLEPNSSFDLGELKTKFNGYEFTNEKIKGYNPPAGFKYLVLKFEFSNLLLKDAFLSFAYLEYTVTSSSGQKITWNRDILFADSDTSVYQPLVAGDPPVKTKVYFQVPEDQNEFNFSIAHTASKRMVTFKTQ